MILMRKNCGSYFSWKFGDWPRLKHFKYEDMRCFNLETSWNVAKSLANDGWWVMRCMLHCLFIGNNFKINHSQKQRIPFSVHRPGWTWNVERISGMLDVHGSSQWDVGRIPQIFPLSKLHGEFGVFYFRVFIPSRIPTWSFFQFQNGSYKLYVTIIINPAQLANMKPPAG